MYLSLECLYFGSPSTGLLTAVLISLLKATLQIEGLKNTAQGRRPSLKITLQSNQVKRSRHWQTNEFISGKMISFVDSIIHS